MSTTLLIDTVTVVELTDNVKAVDSDSIELSEDFLFEFFANDRMLNMYLSKEEIATIRPNWGATNLNSTDTLLPDEMAQYLELLQEVIRTNSDSKLNQFSYDKRLTSDKLEDRAKSPEVILAAINKLLEGLGNDDQLVIKFKPEIVMLVDFLVRKIKDREKVLIEFVD